MYLIAINISAFYEKWCKINTNAEQKNKITNKKISLRFYKKYKNFLSSAMQNQDRILCSANSNNEQTCKICNWSFTGIFSMLNQDVMNFTNCKIWRNGL